MKGRVLQLCPLGLLFMGSVAQAESILYCNDYNLSTDRMAMALDGFESTHDITRTTSLGTCESMIGSGGWDLVIYAVQNWGHSSPQLNSYVSSGGMAIMQDWTSDGSRASAFGIGWSSNNYSSFEVTDSRLSDGLWTTTISLTNPGWGTFSTSFSVYSGDSIATSSYGNAAIGLTNEGRTIVNGFLTDTISDVSLGAQLYTNEINILLGGCDADEDGYERESCGGGDCDDGDPWVNPGAVEVPYDGIDNDCMDGDLSDVDGDGFDWDGVGGLDCDDADPALHPDAEEICDGQDQDCDGLIDEELDYAEWYIDADGDGFGDPVGGVFVCDILDGWVDNDLDCDDTDATIHPDAYEVPYDYIDNDCDGEDLTDLDGDGYDWEGVGGTDCADTDPDVNPGVSAESPDGIDDDCDGAVDDGTEVYDDDGDGYSEAGGDCDDDSSDIHPGALETLDGIDEDCDGIVDEGTEAYDDDGDGFSELEGDCADGDPETYPGAEEVWGDGIDNDCDGSVDSGATDVDGDGYAPTVLGPDGEPTMGDCDDEDGDVHPGAEEVPDLKDNDCDGIIDEGTEYYDDDGDGLTEVDGDCNDADASIYPETEGSSGAIEVADGIDNDCDGDVDEETDAYDDDGDGFSEDAGDCDDDDEERYPGATDVPDNDIDEDCDGSDDGLTDVDGDGFSADDPDPDRRDCDDEEGFAAPDLVEICSDGIDNNCDGEIDEGCADVAMGDDGGVAGEKGGCSTVNAKHSGLAWALALLALCVRRRQEVA